MIESLKIMKWILHFLCCFSLLTSCNSTSNPNYRFNSIDFTYFDISPESFSLRITQNDSVFLKQYFSSNSNIQLKDNIIYSGILNGDIKKQFDSLIASLDLVRLDSTYETGHIDGDEYHLSMESDRLNKKIYVHSMNPPRELTALKKIFLKMKSGLKLRPTDTTINFRTFSLDVSPQNTNSSR